MTRVAAMPWRRASAVVAVAGALMLPMAALAAPSPAPSPSAAPAGEATPAEATLPVTVTVTQVSPQVLRPGEDLTVRATLHNTSTDPAENLRATVRMSRTQMSTRTSLQSWADAGSTRSAGTSLKSVPLPGTLAPGATASVELVVPAASLGLSTSAQAWGARGLAVEATADGRQLGLARTFALWLPQDDVALSSATSVSVLVPVVATDGSLPATTTPGTGTPTASPTSPTSTTAPTDDATSSSDAETETIDPALAPGSRLGSLLSLTAHRTAVSWAVDPALLTRAATGGTTAREWLSLLGEATTHREVFALPYGDPDLSAIAHAGTDDLANQADTLTGSQEWVTAHSARTGLQWPAAGGADGSTLALTARLGASAVVVGSQDLSTPNLSYTPTGLATVTTASGAVPALVPDATLSDLLTTSAGSPAGAAQRILAETAVLSRERPNDNRHVLVTTPRDWAPDAAVAGAQLDALSSAPWVTEAPVSSLISAKVPDVARTDLPATTVAAAEISPSTLTTLIGEQQALSTFATVVADPTSLLAGTQELTLAPLSVGWRADAAGRDQLVQSTVTELTARRSGISVVSGSDVTLIARSSEVPISVHNDLDQAVTVRLHLAPQSACLVVPTAPTVTVAAHDTVSARVPFSAVATCDVVVDVVLTTPDGTPVAATTQFTVRARADWETVGTAVVAGLLVVGLVFGVWRTVRRGQTTRRGARATENGNGSSE